MPDLYSEGFAAGKAAGENNRHSLETTNVRLTNELRSIKFERTRERDRLEAAEALARQQAEEIGMLRSALERARGGFRTYADSVEGHHATKYELAADLRIQADLIDVALSKEEQPC